MKFAVPTKCCADVILEQDLSVEAKGSDLELGALSERVTSAHAPWQDDATRIRLNLSSVREETRQHALQTMERWIEQAHAAFPNLQVIVTHAAPHYFPDPPIRPGKTDTLPELKPELSDWGRLVESMQTLARKCAGLGLVLAVENNWAYWDGIPEDADITKLGPGDFVEYWCSSPAEWRQLAKDVNEPGLGMCLDPSHAVPYCQRQVDVEARIETLFEYVAEPDLIAHLHWNGSDIRTNRGRHDMHLCVGTGTLGDEFHARLKARAAQLPQPVTLEHWHGPDALAAELRYIEALPTPE